MACSNCFKHIMNLRVLPDIKDLQVWLYNIIYIKCHLSHQCFQSINHWNLPFHISTFHLWKVRPTKSYCKHSKTELMLFQALEMNLIFPFQHFLVYALNVWDHVTGLPESFFNSAFHRAWCQFSNGSTCKPCSIPLGKKSMHRPSSTDILM